MLKSMTGFGRSETQNGNYICKVEARSVNNRYLEVNVRLPKFLSPLEFPLKKIIKSQFARGSFDLTVVLEKNEGSNMDPEAIPNLNLAAQYYQALIKIKESLGIDGEVELKSVLALKDLIKLEPPKLDESKEELILGTVKNALDSLRRMRLDEGENLQADIDHHLKMVGSLTESIQNRQPKILEEYKTRLLEKVKSLTEGVLLDENRLTQEVAILAERSDVTEELTRLKSHLKQFGSLFKNKEPLGRKLEFMIQEINRETNTIGSKTSDFEVSQFVIEIKSSLEKIREQLQNIE